MFKNNSFGKDSDGVFYNRIGIMINGLEKYGNSIGFSDDEVAEIKAFVENYMKLSYQAKEEGADEAEFFVYVRLASNDLQKAVYACRKTLRGLSALEGDDVPVYIAERFELDKKVPKRRSGYVAMAENILEGYAALPVEQAGFFVPAPPFERLQAALDKIRTAQEAISRERAEARAKNAEHRRMRKKGERILRNIYLRAVAHWGEDDSRLLELGMVHKSGIWTKKKPKVAGDEG